MRGHLKKRSKDSWSIVIDLGKDASGKRKQKWHTVKGTKKEAEAELSRLLNEVNMGQYIEPTRMLVAQYLEMWLKDYAEPNVSQHQPQARTAPAIKTQTTSYSGLLFRVPFERTETWGRGIIGSNCSTFSPIVAQSMSPGS